MRALKALIALLFVIAGVVLGALNQQLVVIDLFFMQYQSHLGLALIISLLLGALIGGVLVSASLLFKQHMKPVIKQPVVSAVTIEPKL